MYFQNGGGYNDIEEIEYKREQPLIWREDTIVNNGTNGERPSECRNSVQGKTLLVDDEGYVCLRNNLLSNGCCDPNENIQYTCDTCNMEDGCCVVYEKCVSCCLNPNKVGRLFHLFFCLAYTISLSLSQSDSLFTYPQRPILEKAMEMASGRQTALFATVKDQFELCCSKCRTDSHSVQHENKYKNPETKFCYAYIEAHESQRDN